MKVAYLMHGLGFGGAATSLYLLIKSISNYDYKKYLYTSHITFKDALNDLMQYCESFEVIPMKRIYNDLAGGNTQLKDFNKIINTRYQGLIKSLIRDKIDIVHINSSVFPHLLSQIKNETNCRIVTHVREIIPVYGKGEVKEYMIEQIMKYSDAIICISNNEAIPFNSHPNLNIHANPFDFEMVDKAEGSLRSEYKFEKETILIGIAGKFSPSKGQLDFLKSVNHLLNHFNVLHPVKYVLMGYYKFNPLWKVLIKKVINRYDYGYDIKRYIKSNKLEKEVLLLPYTYDFFKYLIDMDIMVRAASSGDPWGRDIIESMAFSKPVIATGRSDFFVKDGVSGYLIPPKRPDLLAEKMFELINDSDKRKQFGMEGERIIRGMTNINDYGKKINSIYQSVIK